MNIFHRNVVKRVRDKNKSIFLQLVGQAQNTDWGLITVVNNRYNVNGMAWAILQVSKIGNWSLK